MSATPLYVKVTSGLVVVFLVFFAIFLLSSGADELTVWVDLDLDLFATGLLDFSFVVGPALLGFLGGFGDGSSSQVVLNRLLYSSRHFGNCYFLLILTCLLIRVDQA